MPRTLLVLPIHPFALSLSLSLSLCLQSESQPSNSISYNIHADIGLTVTLLPYCPLSFLFIPLTPSQTSLHPAMEDTGTVCSMCGDVGFSDELFQCRRCLSRFQHSYCSNYYDEEHNSTAGVCDWCLSEERSEGKHGLASTKHAGKDFSGDNKMKRSSGHEESASRGKSSGSSPSAKSGGRRYKLLKDVL